MLTRCPHCTTTFRVTPEQLKARQGRVRCGQCQETFNALDTLIEAAPPPSLEPLAPPAVEAAAVAGAEPIADARSCAADDAEADAAAVDTAAAVIEAEPADDATEPAAEPAASARTATDIVPTAAPVDESRDEIAPEAPPALEPLLHEEPRRRAWPWALGCATALMTFAAQAAMHFRTEISVLYPATRPTLVAICESLGCEVSLPRKPELIGIETSSLSPDPGGTLTLSATLKNRAPFAQQYPDLELTLTDTGDQPLVRRVLSPADYLAPQALSAAGFGANADLAVNLAVDAPGIPAAGYQLYLFYP
ncbi:MAG: DUF3426 domain-containing protein [Rhodocyclaceae bacterium]|nr:DUF3426 domain-containing protein [Rhodocyclaceae bacterium]